MKQTKLLRLAWCAALALSALSASAQLGLTGTNYFQDFNGIGAGLPTGWSVWVSASGTNLGTATTFNATASTWTTSSGFNNNASTISNSGTNFTGVTAVETASVQAAATNRAPGVRQSGTFAGSDPGAAFVLQLSNTLGAVNFKLSLDFLLLNIQGRSTVWSVDYAVGNTPTNFTLLTSFSDPGVFGATHTNLLFENALDNQPENVWIRLVALSPSTGSNSRDTVGLDNFALSWTSGTTSVTNPPGIISQPVNTTAVVGTTPSLKVVASGAPPLSYQWFKDGNALTNGGNISGANSNVLSFASVLHSNAGNFYVVITNVAGVTNSTTNALSIVGFVIQRVTNTNTLAGVPVTGNQVAFTDPSPAITTVTASSSNQGLVTDGNITVTGAGNSRTVDVTPQSGTNGVALITVTASDGSFTTNTSFAVVVVPSADILFNDHFDYANGPLNTNSAFLWARHSGTDGETQVSNHVVNISDSLSEDVNALLIGRPYSTNSGAVLYSKFTVKFTGLPNAAGSYFAHFKNDSTAGLQCRVWASTLNAATNKFRLGIGNSTAAANNSGQFALDLDTNVTYTVVTRLVVSNGLSTIWVNPASETDTNVTASDAVPVLNNIYSYAFRQNSGEGKSQVDDLVVGTSFAAVTGGATAPGVLLSISKSAGDAILSWPNPNYNLQSATVVTGAYGTINGATSPYTNVAAGTAKYYRLITNQ